MDRNRIISLRGITKTYPGVLALDDFSLDLYEGEVHALLGENGAGKSTLIRVISGAISPDSGIITTADGAEYTSMSPASAHKYGIETVYQELNLVNSMTVAENICMGRRFGRLVNRKAMRIEADRIIKEFNVQINPEQKVENLSNAYKQIVEISKSISRNAKIIILDEPTAALTLSEVDTLFNIIAELKKKDTTVIFISHRLEEVFRICDRVTVLRDGKKINTVGIEDTNRKHLISMMVGRELSDTFPEKNKDFGEVSLRVENLSTDAVSGISFEARRGEILGISGLVGSGRTELARGVIGADKKTGGKVYCDGKECSIRSPLDAIRYGIALIPEDRKNQGALLSRSISWNIPFIYQRMQGVLINNTDSARVTDRYIDLLRIKTPGKQQLVRNLSGGNQQKVVVAKILAADMNVMFFDEPTRGIDVGAKAEMYTLMNDIAAQGKTIIMISSEMVELIGMCSRILVMCEGRLAAELKGSEISQEAILEAASGEK